MIEAYGNSEADAERSGRLRLIAMGLLLIPLEFSWIGGFVDPLKFGLELFLDGAKAVMPVAAKFAVIVWRQHRLAPSALTLRELRLTLTVLAVLAAQTVIAFPFRPRF